MAREDKKKKRKGRHSEGAADSAVQARTPEVAGRQVYPPGPEVPGATLPPETGPQAEPGMILPGGVQQQAQQVQPGQEAPQGQPAMAQPGDVQQQAPPGQPGQQAPPSPRTQGQMPGQVGGMPPAAPGQVEGRAPDYKQAQQRMPSQEQPYLPRHGEREQPDEGMEIPEPPPTVLTTEGPPPESITPPVPIDVEDLLSIAELPEQALPPEPALPHEPALPPEPAQPEETVPEPVPFPGPPPGQYFPPGMPPGQGYYYPPPWYPPQYPAPGPFYGFPQPGGTGQIPVVPGGTMQGMPGGTGPMPGPGVPVPGITVPGAPDMPFGPPMVPPGFPPMSYMPDGPVPPMMLGALEEPEFGSLAKPGQGHWRGDLKWIFGIITALFVFLALASAGMYRITGPGAARSVLSPIIENGTQVKKFVRDNYQDLRARARKSTGSKIYIPDIGVSVSIDGDVIKSLSPEDLADRVVVEVERQIYQQGYRQDLPMKSAQGSGEERGKATLVTLLSKMNKKQHSALVWPILIFSILALAFGILLVVACRGWGKAIGAGLAIIAGAMPGSLFLRVASQFMFKPHVAGTFKPASNAALRSIASMSLSFFDIALAFGALVLVIGVIAAAIARKSRERIPPFMELKRPGSVVSGGPPVEPGMEPEGIPSETESFML